MTTLQDAARRLRACSPLLLLAAPLCGQPANTAPADASDEVVQLSAFEVRSEKDSGYRVQNSVATTGIAQDLRKTPLPITVVTDEFLRDTGRSGFMGAVGYMSSIAVDPATPDGTNPPGIGGGQPNRTRFRGQPYNGTQRNGLSLSVGFDTENTDRIEIAKGPMAVFVGGATLGGVVNLITSKPRFSAFHELTAVAASHNRFRGEIDSTGPINRSLAYRVTASYEEGNTWRDFSHSKTTFVEPQLLWRLGDKYEGRVDAVYRRSEGNSVSYSELSTQNYQSAFDNPPAELLALGNRTLGRPFTVAEYRTRIGQAFGTWRQDVFDLTGEWVSLGTGEAFQAGDWPTGYRANHYGPHAPFVNELQLFETEHTLAATSWLDLRFIGRQIETGREQLYFNFPTRRYAGGNTLLTFGNSRRIDAEALEGKLEAVLKAEFLRTRHTLLLGYQGAKSTSTVETGAWDPTALAPVPGSPNVHGSPATLTGAQIYQWFDPRFHTYPDHRIAQRWASDVRAPGVMAFGETVDRPRAWYAALNSNFWQDRISLTAGYRESTDRRVQSQLDRDRALVGSNDSGKITTDSYMYGSNALGT